MAALGVVTKIHHSSTLPQPLLLQQHQLLRSLAMSPKRKRKPLPREYRKPEILSLRERLREISWWRESRQHHINFLYWLLMGVLLLWAFGALIERQSIAVQTSGWPHWTGIGERQSVAVTTEKDATGTITGTVETVLVEPEKTLWDWLSLLGVPLSLAILGYWLQQQQQRRAEEISKQQRKAEEDESKEEVLQAYFDRISTLLIEKNLLSLASEVHTANESSNATPEQRDLLDVCVDIIRARTLSILRRLGDDGRRKGSAIRFLLDAEIISRTKLSLRSAYLYQVDLPDADLSRSDFRDAWLARANLINARLVEAKLSNAHLRGASLENADLQGANLSDADLSGACLAGADLTNADLSGANLSEANLVGANLTNADLSGTNLSKSNLVRATLIRANLANADISNVIFLQVDLRTVRGLTEQQLLGEMPPLLCNSPIPEHLQDRVVKDRDCNDIAFALSRFYAIEFDMNSLFYLPLKETRAWVEEARSKDWM